jgi:hypothetical protein
LVPRAAADFVTDYIDASPVVFTFSSEPNLTHLGTQEVTIVATDGAGNEARETAQLTLRADTEAPVIRGVVDLHVQTGDTVSYLRDAVASDNCPEGLELTVDTSAVDIQTAGSYSITYTARDLAGNEAKRTVRLYVWEREYDVEAIYAKADAVIAQIMTADMTQRQQLRAIYQYTINNIYFESGSAKETWERAAYEGFFERRGDCYVFACTVKVLLDRVGIKNELIQKIVTSRRHYWNLVDLGEGWYHFDTTPRPDHPYIFLWTDEQLMEYSGQHNNSHRYDRDIYPSDGRPVN